MDIFKGERTETFETPPKFIEYLELMHGVNFDLDVCAEDHTAKAPKWFTIDDDCLTRNWDARTAWMNPPYGRKIAQFLEKGIEEVEKGNCRELYVLIPARVDTQWFHDLVVPKASHVYLIKGRFNFKHSSAVKNANAPFPSMLVIFNHLGIQWNFASKILPMAVPKEYRGFD